MSFAKNIDTVNRLEDLTNHSYNATLTGTQELMASLIGAGTIRIGITGIWTGDLKFERSLDGVNWLNANCVPFDQVDPTGSAAIVNNTTENGNWVSSGAACTSFRVRAASITSGAANVWVEINGAITVVDAVVLADGLIDSHNTTDTPLGPNEVFLGEPLDLLPFAQFTINITADVDSAPSGSKILFSTDGISWSFENPFFFTVGNPLHLTYDRRARFVRVRYVNGPVAQTSFHLQCIATRTVPAIPKQTLAQPIQPFRQAMLTQAIIAGRVKDSSPEEYVDALVDADGTLHVAPAVLAPNASTESTLAAIKAKTDNLDVLLSSRTKPSDTQNVVVVAPGVTIWKQVEPTTTQTGTAIWTPASGNKVAVTSLDIIAKANITLTIWWSKTSVGDTAFTQGTDQPLFRGDVTNGQSYLFQFPFARIADLADMPLRLTTSANGQVFVTIYGYETT